MFNWREREPGEGETWGVDWAVTDRHGGVSDAPFGSLNLGAGVDDDPEHVAANRALLAEAVGVAPGALRFLRQVHGDTVVQVGAHDGGPAPLTAAPEGDVLLTDSADVALVVLVADCTPVLLVDRVAALAAAVHAGRNGMMVGAVPAAVSAMRERGGGSIEAVVGPSICARCYEVPEALRAEAAAVAPASHARSRTGTPAIDVAAGVVQQLERLDVPVRRLPGCSREDESLFSHRRDGRTGRYGAVVRLLAPGGEQ